MRKSITIILLLATVFLALFSCNGPFLDPNVNDIRNGGFSPNPKDKGKNPGNNGNPGNGGNPITPVNAQFS